MWKLVHRPIVEFNTKITNDKPNRYSIRRNQSFIISTFYKKTRGWRGTEGKARPIHTSKLRYFNTYVFFSIGYSNTTVVETDGRLNEYNLELYVGETIHVDSQSRSKTRDCAGDQCINRMQDLSISTIFCISTYHIVNHCRKISFAPHYFIPITHVNDFRLKSSVSHPQIARNK